MNPTTKSNNDQYQNMQQGQPQQMENGLPPQKVQPHQEPLQVVYAQPESAGNALCLLIAGLFIPILLVVNVCLYIGSKVPKQKSYAQASLGILIAWILLFILCSL